MTHAQGSSRYPRIRAGRALYRTIGALMFMALVGVGCSGDTQPAEQEEASAPTAEPAPTATPEPAPTAAPTSTPAPTATPVPPTPEPTSTPEPAPTVTPILLDRLRMATGFGGASQVSTERFGAPVQSFDSFTAEASATVNQVEWRGMYCMQGMTDPPTPTASAFMIAVYGGDDRPDIATPLFSQSVGLDDTDETLKRTITATCGPQRSAFSIYAYSARLTDGFILEANKKYWISIQAITPSFDTRWFWQDSNATFGSSLRLVNQEFSNLNLARAFRLITDTPQE